MPPKTRAFITGISGQDGAYLAQGLLAKGYEVFGLHRAESLSSFWRLKSLGIFDKIRLIAGDLRHASSLESALASIQPDEIYNLAAFSLGGNASFEDPMGTLDVNGMGVVRLLEAVRLHSPKARVFLALSGEIFGTAAAEGQRFNETSPFLPISPYGTAKCMAAFTARQYRERHGLFVACGILFNHESPLRSTQYVTRKISVGVARIALGLEKTLPLGDLTTRRDWGLAVEYTDAMWRMLQAKRADDFVIATGKTYSVEDLVQAAFESVKLRPSPYLVKDPSARRTVEIRSAGGDPSKIKKELGWSAATDALGVIRLMTQEDLKGESVGSPQL